VVAGALSLPGNGLLRPSLVGGFLSCAPLTQGASQRGSSPMAQWNWSRAADETGAEFWPNLAQFSDVGG